MANYRKIYEQYYGVKIPKGYHVHHKDMNHENDDPLNLECLHKDVHAQKHGFLSNFIMAQSTAIERAAIGRKRLEWRNRKSKDMMGNANGKGNKGKKLTTETKAKIRIAMTGRIMTPEHKAKLSASKMGNTNTRGLKHTAQSKANMSFAAKNRKKQCYL